MTLAIAPIYWGLAIRFSPIQIHTSTCSHQKNDNSGLHSILKNETSYLQQTTTEFRNLSQELRGNSAHNRSTYQPTRTWSPSLAAACACIESRWPAAHRRIQILNNDDLRPLLQDLQSEGEETRKHRGEHVQEFDSQSTIVSITKEPGKKIHLPFICRRGLPSLGQNQFPLITCTLVLLINLPQGQGAPLVDLPIWEHSFQVAPEMLHQASSCRNCTSDALSDGQIFLRFDAI